MFLTYLTISFFLDLFWLVCFLHPWVLPESTGLISAIKWMLFVTSLVCVHNTMFCLISNFHWILESNRFCFYVSKLAILGWQLKNICFSTQTWKQANKSNQVKKSTKWLRIWAWLKKEMTYLSIFPVVWSENFRLGQPLLEIQSIVK